MNDFDYRFNKSRDRFDASFDRMQNRASSLFGFIIFAWVLGGIASLGLVGALIYFLIKFAGTLH